MPTDNESHQYELGYNAGFAAGVIAGRAQMANQDLSGVDQIGGVRKQPMPAGKRDNQVNTPDYGSQIR